MADTRLAELELDMEAVRLALRLAVQTCGDICVSFPTSGYVLISSSEKFHGDRHKNVMREAYKAAVIDLLPSIRALAADRLLHRKEDAEAAFRNECSKRAHET